MSTKELWRRRNIRGVFLSWLAKIKVVEVRLLRMARFFYASARYMWFSRWRSRKGYPVSIHRISATDAGPALALFKMTFFADGEEGGSGEGSLLPPSQRWLLPARSTWLIAGVILARLTFGIKWQLRSPPGAATRRRESLGRKFRSLAGEHKSWLQITAITHCAEASARIFQPRAESAIPSTTTWRDRALFFIVALPLASAP